MEDVVDGERAKYIGQLSPKLAEFMLAARRVYQDGASLAGVAREESLREDVLRKWVGYLKPAPFSRPYLNEWQSASADKLAEVAKGYQARFEDRADGPEPEI